MIQLRDFCFRYRECSQPAVMDVNLDIPAGSFTGITGPAGSGKSTLTYALNGIVPYCYPGDFYGEVLIDGHDTCDTSLTDISRLVGSVCQDIDSQFVASVVEDEMLYGLENFGVAHDLLVIMQDGRVRFADVPAAVLARSEELLSIGVNCPRSTTLMNRLAAAGLYAGPVCTDVAQASRALLEVVA